MSHGMEVSGVCLLRPQTDPQPRPQRPLQKGLEQPKEAASRSHSAGRAPALPRGQVTLRERDRHVICAALPSRWGCPGGVVQVGGPWPQHQQIPAGCSRKHPPGLGAGSALALGRAPNRTGASADSKPRAARARPPDPVTAGEARRRQRPGSRPPPPGSYKPAERPTHPPPAKQTAEHPPAPPLPEGCSERSGVAAAGTITRAQSRRPQGNCHGGGDQGFVPALRARWPFPATLRPLTLSLQLWVGLEDDL